MFSFFVFCLGFALIVAAVAIDERIDGFGVDVLVYIKCKVISQLTIVGLVLIVVDSLLKLVAIKKSNCNLVSIKYPSFQCINRLKIPVSSL